LQQILPRLNQTKALVLSQCYNVVIANTIHVKTMAGRRQGNTVKKVLQLEQDIEVSYFQGVNVGSRKLVLK
jgi:hypothetical protein